MYHVGLAIDSMGVHGAVRRIVELGNALTSAGHWVTIYSPDGAKCAWLPQLSEAAPYAALPGHKLDALVYAAGLESAYDAVIKSTAKVKIHYMLSIPHPEVLLNPQDAYTKRVVSILRSPEWIIAGCSTALTDDLKRYVREDAITIFGGINRSIFHHRKTGGGNGTRNILSSGDFREREGSLDAKAAAGIVSKKYSDVAWATYFKRGYNQNQMAECYSSARIFLDAQRYAGWNNAVAEAMACGTPVVCTNIGGSKDLAEHGVTALVVPAQDIAAMADACMVLLEDLKLREKLVKGAMERIAAYTYSVMAYRLERIIDGRISGKHQADNEALSGRLAAWANR